MTNDELNEELSFEGFCDFVASKDPEEVINHRYGWGECAVGLYVGSVLKEQTRLSFFSQCRCFAKLLSNYSMEALGEIYSLQEILNDSGLAIDFCPTYGELNNLLESASK